MTKEKVELGNEIPVTGGEAGRFTAVYALHADPPFDDLRSFDPRVVDASMVGMGVSERFTHELTLLQQRLLRWLIEDHGFRILILEEDWTKGIELDRWLRGGNDDAFTALNGAWGVWRTREMVEVLSWLRERNRRHPDDPVRIAGVDVTRPRSFAYDEVVAFSQAHQPGHATEIADAYAALQKDGGKGRAVLLARRVTELLAGLPDLELAGLHARLIEAYHALHAGETVDTEALFATNAQWWTRKLDRKAVIWGGLAHTAAAPSTAWRANVLAESYGSHLRTTLGAHYVSIGLMFDHGEGLHLYPPPPEHFREAQLTGADGSPVRALDIVKAAQSTNTELAGWIREPATVRVVGPHFAAERNREFSMGGASLQNWFDVLIHIPQVTPASFLAEPV